MKKPIRVLVIDSQEISRIGLAANLEKDPHFVLVGESGYFKDILRLSEKTKPDIVVAALNHPERDIPHVQFCHEMMPCIKIVAFANVEVTSLIASRLGEDISGCITRDFDGKAMLEALSIVAEGRGDFDRKHVDRPFEQQREAWFPPKSANFRKFPRRKGMAKLHMARSDLTRHEQQARSQL